MRPAYRNLLILFTAIGGVAGCDRAATTESPQQSEALRTSNQAAATPTHSPGPRSPSETRIATEPKAIEIVYRPDDDRPRHDDAALERAGIRRYESKRLVLYTDIDRDKAVRLPRLVDALYEELTSYFGPLAPQRDGAEWQVTGYVMADADLFKTAGLVPSNLPTFEHGLNRRRRFWMREQSLDYYLEHLLLHEVTHCFMTTMPVPGGPTWYMEGMAEHFAAHRQTADGGVQFRIFPDAPNDTPGFDRIALIRKAVDRGRIETLDGVFAIPDHNYVEPTPYAWAWAVCHLLDAHPAYHGRFLELGDVRLRGRFRDEFDSRFANDADQLRLEWQQFARTLCYGYELDRAVLDLSKGNRIPKGDSEVRVQADRGWQATEFHLEANRDYELKAAGQFSLCEMPKPWLSDANGISIDYANGRPLGRLMAAVVPDDLMTPEALSAFDEPVDIGILGKVSSRVGGTLHLRINDGWNRLSDNRGEVTVRIAPSKD